MFDTLCYNGEYDEYTAGFCPLGGYMKRFFRLLPLFLLAAALCGCELRSGEDLLAAPKPTEEFLALQTELDKELAAGAVYAAPAAGANRGYVQLIDLNGDSRDEAVAFFRTSAMSNEFAVKVYEQQEDGSYANLGEIQGIGVSVGEVSFPQMTGDGGRAIQISWQVTGENNLSISVSALRDGGVDTLLATEYTNCVNADFDEDGLQDLLLLRLDSTSGEKKAELYTFEQGCRLAGTAMLSPDAVSITRLTTGVTDGQLAAFAEEKDESGVGQQTDILLYWNGALRNIAYDTEQVGAPGTYRSVSVNAADVDGDGETEIPRAVLMVGYPEGSADALYMFDWYAYRREDAPAYKLTTFRSAAERWYLIIPSEWHDAVYAVRNTMAGMSVTTFCEYQPESGTDPEAGLDTPLLSIYYLTGQSRQYQANQMGLTVLKENENALWAAAIPENASRSGYAIDMETVQQGFRLMKD